MTREQRRNPQLRYNMRSIDQIRKDYPNFDWDTYFSSLGVDGVAEANIASTSFMEFLDSYLPTLSEQQIKDYLMFEMVSDSSGVLSDDFKMPISRCLAKL